MRIGCLQFAPQVGDVNNNLNRADAVLNKANPESLDLLVLPELAFSGYNFKSLQQISPFLEPSGSGISSLWARTNALKYDCTVVVGYPEKVDVSEKWPTSPEYYNSAIIVNPDGETIANYRKTFLFYMDETWALEGEGFFGGWLPGLGQTAMGICMDVNPYQFQAPWSAFEFAYHILDIEANLVIVSLAWLTREDQRTFSRMPKEPDMDTLIYWLARMEPVIRADTEDEIIVVLCNRTGVEDDAVYAGTSTVLGIGQGEVNVYGILGRGDKELLVVDTEKPPFGRLVYRPNDSEDEFKPEQVVLADSHSEHSSRKSSRDSQRAPTPRNPTPTPAQPKEGARGRTSGSTKSRKMSPSCSPSNRSVKSRTSSKSSASRTGGHKRSRSVGLSQAQLQQYQQPHAQATPASQQPVISPRKVRPAQPKITIPVTRPHHDDNIPTPTGPSPTPIDLRPNFGVPTSSRGKHPDRDDTPHPATAVRDPWRVYGTRSAKHRSYTPVTPFHDVASASSPRYFWVPSDTLLKTPALPEESWKAMRGHENHKIDTPTTAVHMHSGNNLGRSQRDVLPKKQTPRPRESRRAGSPSASSQTSITSGRMQNKPVSAESLLDHPNPPVSSSPIAPRPAPHQTSRPGGSDRPGSATSHKLYLESVNKRLESLPKKPGSAMEQRQPTQESNAPHRPKSPKSRNASRSRAEVEPAIDTRLGDFAQSSILIAASPSVHDGGMSHSGSSSSQRGAVDALRALADSRHGSSSRHASSATEKYERQRFQAVHISEIRRAPAPFVDPHDRTVSRGRQRERRCYYHEERSHSADSTIPEVNRSRFPSPEPQARDDNFVAVEGRVSADCPVHGADPQWRTITVGEIAATEIHVSANCPVHGSRCRTVSNRTRAWSTQRKQSSTQPSLGHSSHTGRKTAKRCGCNSRESTQRGTSHPRESAHRRDSDRRRDSSRERPYAEQAQPHVSPQVQPNSCSKAELVCSNSAETVTAPAESETPRPEPSTPKAMILRSKRERNPIAGGAKTLLLPFHASPESHGKSSYQDDLRHGKGLRRPASSTW